MKNYIFFVDRENVSVILTIEDMEIFEKDLLIIKNNDIYTLNVIHGREQAEAESF